MYGICQQPFPPAGAARSSLWRHTPVPRQIIYEANFLLGCSGTKFKIGTRPLFH